MQTLVTNDAQIRDNVIEEMIYDPMVTINDIAVVVRDGVVTLTGIADSYGTRSAAGAAAWRISGVVDVFNDIVVDPTLLGQPTDAEIASDIRERLDKDFLVPKGRVSITVLDGVVTLSGSVNWHIQREAAIEEAEDAKGVRDVVNLIIIDRGAASPKNVESEIKKALTRNAQVDATGVQVTADGGTVTLSGTVRSYAERQEAESAAWRANGTTGVVNRITIQSY